MSSWPPSNRSHQAKSFLARYKEASNKKEPTHVLADPAAEQRLFGPDRRRAVAAHVHGASVSMDVLGPWGYRRSGALHRVEPCPAADRVAPSHAPDNCRAGAGLRALLRRSQGQRTGGRRSVPSLRGDERTDVLHDL